MVFKWRSTASLIGKGVQKLNPQAIGSHLEKLNNVYGSLTARQIVDDAKHPGAPTHDVFEWNDSLAAEAHRLHQARMLMSAVVTVSESSTGETEIQRRVFVSIESEEGASHYETLAHVLSDSEKRAQFLAKALSEFEAWQSRYEMYEELAAIFSAAETVKEELSEPDSRSPSVTDAARAVAKV